jgi:hypothetical protein
LDLRELQAALQLLQLPSERLRLLHEPPDFLRGQLRCLRGYTFGIASRIAWGGLAGGILPHLRGLDLPGILAFSALRVFLTGSQQGVYGVRSHLTQPRYTFRMSLGPLSLQLTGVEYLAGARGVAKMRTPSCMQW